MDGIIRYSRKVPLWKIILGLAAIFVGLLGLASLVYFAVVPLVFGFMMLKTDGSEIDLESKTYRKTGSILGYSIGKWQSLENPEYVSVFNTTENITVRVITAETTNSFPIIVVNIFYDRNKKITVHKTEDIENAFNAASHIADALSIDLLDATVKNDYKWVDKIAFRETGNIIYTD
tara:strand:- start:534 stop:1061 length:528 start_codon:yes stop_codon:yes gene_type:complete